MEKIDTDTLANIQFRLQYEYERARHTAIYHAQRLNLWRDVLPAALLDGMMSRSAGDQLRLDLSPGEIVEPYRETSRQSIKLDRFRRSTPDEYPIEPRCGRFYPKGLLRGMRGIFRGNTEPFRCVNVDSEAIEVDFNHPLSGRSLKLSAVVERVIQKNAEHGGSSTDRMELITRGPGMQSRYNGKPTDFFSNGAFRREDEENDGAFYTRPRFVDHVDDHASASIGRLYADLIPPHAHLLDLMSSWTSHLPSNLALASVTGLGMNRSELEFNERLDRHRVQDLNADPVLPFDSGAFDAAVCSLSVEYLIRPMTLFKEVARVLKEDGIFVVTFSNRWFPPKAIEIWTGLHEFERLGLVLEYFMQSGCFTRLATLSIRGYPRPVDDKYYPQLRHSDPVYAVWGFKSEITP